jgi:N-acetylglucosaminyldiphosphoundecaprenol N-acetyl-beta-D-mannosaminyltransferase
MKIKEILNQINPITFSKALEYIAENAKKSGKKTFVVTINPEIIMLATRDKEYEKALKAADLLVNDGIGVVWARKMFGMSSKGRIHGADLLEKLSELASKENLIVGYLGGGKNVALDVSKCLSRRYPGLKVSFAVEEWPSNELRFRNQESNRYSHNSKFIIHNSQLICDILFVAFGSPKQEKWIYENLPKLKVNVAIGVGGAFDFTSGKVRRAPVWVRRIGLEWLFRLIIQPWRIKRQIVLPKFVFLVLREKILG